MASKVNKPQKAKLKSTKSAPASAKAVSAKTAKATTKATKTKPAAKTAPKKPTAAKPAAKTKAATTKAAPKTAVKKPATKADSKPKTAAKATPKAAAKTKAKPAAKLDTVKVTSKTTEKTQDKVAAFKAAVAKSAAKSAKAAKPTTKAPQKTAAKPTAKPEPSVASKVNSTPMKKPEAAKLSKEDTAPAKAAVKADVKPEARKEEKRPNPRSVFKPKEFVVYPAHGVGQILDVEEQEVAGHKLELFVINFDKEKMTLRVPTNKWESVGMRKLSSAAVVGNAIDTLRGRARIKRTMWSRRAQEYEAKINSGDLISIAEVVRDLYRSERQPEQSYSERQLYEAALDRMAREVAVVEGIDDAAAVLKVETTLQSGSGRSEKTSNKEEPEAA